MSIAKKINGQIVPLSSGANTPLATSSTAGSVRPDGTTIVVDNNGVISGTIQSTPIATPSVAGKVKPDNNTINITLDGTISANVPDATPIATVDTAGKVKPDGTTITIDNQGTISSNISAATSSSLGIVKPDNSTITINNGILSASYPTATSSALGMVKPDNSTITISNGVISSNASPSIATTSNPGIVKPDGTDLGINTSTGLLSFDPNNFRFDRRKLYPDDADNDEAYYSFNVTDNVNAGISSYQNKVCDIFLPGIYFISVTGTVTAGSSLHCNLTFYLDDDTSLSKGIGDTLVRGYNSNGYYAFFMSGVMVAKNNHEIFFGTQNKSNGSTTVTNVSGKAHVIRLYGFDTPTVTNKWWQQTSI